MEIMNVCDLKKGYSDDGASTHYVVDGVSLSLEEYQSLAIMGKSGSGKTTLLKMIGSMEKPSAGTVYFRGKDLCECDYNQLSEFRRKKIGFIFQDFRLLNHLSVKDNIILPGLLDGEAVSGLEKRMMGLAERLDIVPLLSKYPYEISGGEKQRAAICRAFINNPDMILADEPTGNLDSKSSEKVLGLLFEMKRELKKSVIVVTHDRSVAEYCDRIVMMRDGKVVDDNTPFPVGKDAARASWE